MLVNAPNTLQTQTPPKGFQAPESFHDLTTLNTLRAGAPLESYAARNHRAMMNNTPDPNPLWNPKHLYAPKPNTSKSKRFEDRLQASTPFPNPVVDGITPLVFPDRSVLFLKDGRVLPFLASWCVVDHEQSIFPFVFDRSGGFRLRHNADPENAQNMLDQITVQTADVAELLKTQNLYHLPVGEDRLTGVAEDKNLTVLRILKAANLMIAQEQDNASPENAIGHVESRLRVFWRIGKKHPTVELSFSARKVFPNHQCKIKAKTSLKEAVGALLVETFGDKDDMIMNMMNVTVTCLTQRGKAFDTLLHMMTLVTPHGREDDFPMNSAHDTLLDRRVGTRLKTLRSHIEQSENTAS